MSRRAIGRDIVEATPRCLLNDHTVEVIPREGTGLTGHRWWCEESRHEGEGFKTGSEHWSKVVAV